MRRLRFTIQVVKGYIALPFLDRLFSHQGSWAYRTFVPWVGIFMVTTDQNATFWNGGLYRDWLALNYGGEE